MTQKYPMGFGPGKGRSLGFGRLRESAEAAPAIATRDVHTPVVLRDADPSCVWHVRQGSSAANSHFRYWRGWPKAARHRWPKATDHSHTSRHACESQTALMNQGTMDGPKRGIDEPSAVVDARRAFLSWAGRGKPPPICALYGINPNFMLRYGRPLATLRTASIPAGRVCAPPHGRIVDRISSGSWRALGQETRRDGRAAPSPRMKIKKKKKEIFLVLYYCDVD